MEDPLENRERIYNFTLGILEKGLVACSLGLFSRGRPATRGRGAGVSPFEFRWGVHFFPLLCVN